ncbi:MAG: glycosyltransferase family 4 protein [Solirubrobacterales bacterium]|nr:glycosyltransferase family 4 protein [Solirubrobacterales bacterium]
MSLKIAMMGLRGIPATHGGIEYTAEALSLELADRGHDVTVYARNAYAPSRDATYRGVKLRYLPQLDTKHLEAASHTVLAVLDALRMRRFDVLHIHATGPALFSVLPRLVGTPTVVTVHALDWRREKWGPMARGALRAGLRIAATVPDRTIVVSQELERHLREVFGGDPVHIPNGIDPGLFEATEPVEGLEPGGFLLFLGRLVPEKGIHTLLRAFARTNLRQRLVIAGPGTHSSQYVRELEQLAARDPRVTLLGPVYGPQKAWLLKNAALMVNPSTLEGMPIVVLEGGACARPLLLSDIPEHLEVVRENGTVHAATFPVGNETALAQELELAVADPHAPARGEALRRLVLERYRWGTIAESTERVYEEALRVRA